MGLCEGVAEDRAGLRHGGTLLQMVSGDFSAKGVAKNQPVKLAAMEEFTGPRRTRR